MVTEFGVTLRERRIEAGFGLREFAELIEISASYLSRVETGAIESAPSEEVIVRMAEELACESDELLLLAGRVPADVQRYIVDDPRVLKNLRRRMARQ